MDKEVLQVLFFWVDETKSIIDDGCLKKVEEQIKGVTSDKLYLVLHTSGGDPFAAVRIIRTLQQGFKEIFALIPSHAMSAGTLMSVGTDKIYMSTKSMLGPLDLPVEHPTDGSRISALDFKNTITTISSLSDSIAKERYDFLRSVGRLGKKSAAELAFSSATKLVEPIVQQIDPYHLQKSARELRIAWFYAYDLLTSRMMKDDPKKAWETAKNLVNFFPSHDYGIFINDAKSLLNLDVEDLYSLEQWSTIRPHFEAINSLETDAILRKEIQHAKKNKSASKKS